MEQQKEKLPACLDGLSEESKAKQYEALDKMSDEEKKAHFDIIETQESFDLKNGELHSLYEQRRTMADDDPRAADLDDRMSELSSQLERPDNIDEVKNR